MNDSASYYYQKELLLAQNTQNANNIEAAYKGFYELYKSIGMTDSVAKYADLCYLTSDEQYQQSSAEELRHMHALYNYNRNQLSAMTKTKEAAEMRLYLFVIILFTLFLSVIIAFRVYKWLKRKQEELQAIVIDKQREIQLMQEKYDKMMQQQEHARFELSKIQKSTYEALLKEKESEIRKRQSEIDELEGVLHAKLSIDEELLSCDICRRFHYYANHPLDKFSNQVMNRVMSINPVTYKFPNSSDSIYALTAQNISNVFPYLVSSDGEFVDYTELIPILVKAIKEMQAEIDELQSAISLTRSDGSLDSNSSSWSPMSSNARAVLYQNSPNPFTNTTTIRFTLPDDVQNAYIYIFDMSGKMQKQIPVDASMQSVSIQGYELSAGMYIYALVIGGKEVDSKRMILSK